MYATHIAQNWENSACRIKDYVANSDEDIFPDAPIRLRLLHALGVAPSFLVSRFRTIRNKLEHEYKVPTIQEVREAIDLAHIFMGCVDNALSIAIYFHIVSKFFGTSKCKDSREVLEQELTIGYWNGKFEILASHPEKNIKKKIINPNDAEYLPLLRISIALEAGKNIEPAHYDLMRSIGISVPTGAHNPTVDYC